MQLQVLIEQVKACGISSETVEDMVHDFKAYEAITINDGGLEEQLEYLLTCCGGKVDLVLYLLKEVSGLV